MRPITPRSVRRRAGAADHQPRRGRGRVPRFAAVQLGENRSHRAAPDLREILLPAPMPRLPVGHAIWRPRPDFRVAVESWLTAGGAHHTVMSTQLGVAVFVAFASMCGVEIVVIDEGTTAEGVRRGLRADAAYYRG